MAGTERPSSRSRTLLALLVAAGLAACAPLGNAGPRADYTDSVSGMEFAFVPGGTYLMGDASGQYPEATPVREVRVGDLFVGIHEVTFAQFDLFSSATGREPLADQGWGRGDRPAIRATWQEARDYAEWLSRETGLRFRLPSEAEWEYFARAGTATPFWAGENLPPATANCSSCGSDWDDRMTAPVGSFPPNPWGICDTAGNVVEWTLDDYAPGYAGAPADGSPRLVPEGRRKVQRGGAWNSPVADLRSAARDARKQEARTPDAGFRLVLEPAADLLPAGGSTAR